MNHSYMAGRNAANLGKEIWENPFCDSKSKISDSQSWFAGWCYQKKILSADFGPCNKTMLNLREFISTMKELNFDSHMITMQCDGNIITVEVKIVEVAE